MRCLGIPFFFFALQLSLGESPEKTSPTPSLEQIVRMEQELYDAVAPGIKAPWEKYYADDAIYADEAGRVMSKRELLADFSPLPDGYSGTIKVTTPRLRTAGTALALTFDADEYETIFGQTLHTVYRVTDVWAPRNGQWQIVTTQVMVLLNDPVTQAVSPAILDRYVGTYELAPDVTYTVRRDGNKLVGQRKGRSQEELLPELENVFFRKSNRARKIFLAGPDGKIAKMIDRRDGNDLVWKRSPERAYP